jgi:glyoxylase-like metal-dependent hydrolase (beta-lactamase superfamily II)
VNWFVTVLLEIITIKGFTNNFLVKFDEGYLLIDTFLTKKYNRFQKKLEKLGIDISEIKYLLITHHHTDHVGFIEELRKDHDIKLIVHEKAVKYLEEGKVESYTRPINFISRFVMFFVIKILGSTFPPVTIKKDDIIIREDKSLILKSLLGMDAVILRTPGSTEDNLSIIFADGQTITGDIIINLPRPLKFRNQPALFTTKEEVFHSWELLKQHNAKILYPSHGKPLTLEQLMKRKKKLQKKR